MYLGSVPPVLVRSSVVAAMRIAAGQATLGVVSAGVATLLKRVTWSMLMAKYQILGLSLVMTATVATGLVTGAQKGGDNKRAAAPQQSQHVTQTVARDRINTVPNVPRDYIVEPPDMLVVEVLQALPGRPISGERLVRPDGKISLGYYGELYVAGQNLTQIKAKVVNHLRGTLSDESLGLVVHDMKSGRDLTAKPEDSDRVFVDVAKINSKNIYVQGDVANPGRFPWTGNQTVLDMVNLAGGLNWGPENSTVMLNRMNPAGGRLRKIPINIKEVMLGSDASTNYVLEPGDRLVAMKKPDDEAGATSEGATAEKPVAQQSAEAQKQSGRDEPTLRDLDNRLSRMEQTLERILKRLDDRDQ